jgi:lysophospholipase L1-like esterase
MTFWLLLPLTALQGLWLKFRATRLPGAQGERRGSSGYGNTLRLLAIGDSIIDGVGVQVIEESLAVQFAGALAECMRLQVDWFVHGESGLDINGLMDRLETLDQADEPDIILISIGVNDVTGLSSTSHWRRSVGRLLDRLNSDWPGAFTVFTGLPPMSRFPLPPQPLRFSLGMRAATFDTIASGLIAERVDAQHIPTLIDPLVNDFCEDGFHPSAASNQIWAKELATAIIPRLRPTPEA